MMFTASLLSALLCAPAAPIAVSKDRSVIRSVWGIVVGIESYSNLAIPQRPFARNDALAVYDFVTAKEGLGAPRDQVALLTDRPDDRVGGVLATADNLRAAIGKVNAAAGPEDLLILFVRLSGLPAGDEFRWLGFDAVPESYARTSILTGELAELFAEIPCHWVLSYLDVCFEGPAESLKLNGAIADANWNNIFQPLNGPGHYVFSANNGRWAAPVDSSRKQGLFAAVFLDGLRGGADAEGGEADSWVTANELWTYIEREVPARATQLYGSDANAVPQKVGEANIPALFLTSHLAVRPEADRRIHALRALHQQKVLSDDLLDEGSRLLDAMPRFPPERRLREAYRDLTLGKIEVATLSKVREEAIRQRQVDPQQARAFADAILEARDLIARNYVEPDRGNPAVVAGIEGLFRQAAEPIPPQISETLAKLDELPPEELANLLMKIRIVLGIREDLQGDQAIDVCLGAMFRSLDPYSRFIPRQRLEEDRRSVDGHFAGLGLAVRYDPAARELVVVTPILESPAFGAGIRAGDKIVAIDGKHVHDMQREEAIGLLNGELGKSRRLTILPLDAQKTLEKEVRFAQVKVETVVGVRRKANQSWDFWLESSGIAYVRILGFDSHTADDLRRAIGQLRKEKRLSGLILDLRYNGGGLFSAAVDVASLFVKGAIVTKQMRDGAKSSYRGRDFFRFDDFPLVVLINRGSASGSEIVAAAIADHRRGIVVGERSYGKGSIQDILDLQRSHGAVRLTTATFKGPNGKNLHRGPAAKQADSWGVVPAQDNFVPLLREESQRLETELREREIIRSDVAALPVLDVADPQLERAVQWLEAQKGGANKADR